MRIKCIVRASFCVGRYDRIYREGDTGRVELVFKWVHRLGHEVRVYLEPPVRQKESKFNNEGTEK